MIKRELTHIWVGVGVMEPGADDGEFFIFIALAFHRIRPGLEQGEMI
jgi:hypothetical protein